MKKGIKITLGLVSFVVIAFLVVYIRDRKRLGAEEANKQWKENVTHFIKK